MSNFTPKGGHVVSSAVVALVLTLAGVANAETFSTELPELLGPNQFEGLDTQTTSYDFGLTVSAVDHVLIELEATVTPLEYDYCGTLFDPKPCRHVIRWVGFLAGLRTQDPGYAFLAGLDGYRAESRTVTARFETTAEDDLSFMFDGRGQIYVGWNHPLGFPEDIIINVVQPTAVITDARLIFDAVPVPEPAASLSGPATVAVLAYLCERRRRTLHCANSQAEKGRSSCEQVPGC